MWWWIDGVAIALIAFVCWIALELIHALIVDDVLIGFTLDDDDEEDGKEIKL